MSPAADRRWLILAIVGAAFFMTVLDVAIVNVAIPSIQRDLNVNETTVQWVLIAYSITFGGFLLLGGRMADLLGRKRIFIVGLVLFTLASLVCGLANDISVLIGARAVQGIGAAIISPAALSIVTTTFEEGAERNKALGIWGALGGSGAAAGVLAGGIITKYLGWEWIFFVNVPVGALVLALALPIVPESKADLDQRGFDVAARSRSPAASRCSCTRSRRRPTSAGGRRGRSCS
jgi:MFS family permease